MGEKNASTTRFGVVIMNVDKPNCVLKFTIV